MELYTAEAEIETELIRSKGFIGKRPIRCGSSSAENKGKGHLLESEKLPEGTGITH